MCWKSWDPTWPTRRSAPKQIEDESFDTPEEAADISARHAVAEREVERLEQEVAEASQDVYRANELWEYYSGEGSDDDDS